MRIFIVDLIRFGLYTKIFKIIKFSTDSGKSLELLQYRGQYYTDHDFHPLYL